MMLSDILDVREFCQNERVTDACYRMILVYRAFFVNNISGYAKFPMTWSFRYLPKKLAILYTKFFPVIFFKYNPKNFPFLSRMFDLFSHLPQKQSPSSQF